MTVSEADFKRAMASFAAGVTVITTVDPEGKPFGLTATAFSSVSKSPPLCLVCVSLDAEALPALRSERRFAVNLLERSQEAVSNRFATHGIDKFQNTAWSPGNATKCPILDGALASMECHVETVVPAGDHEVFIGRIARIHLGTGEPLVYFRGAYRDLAGR